MFGFGIGEDLVHIWIAVQHLNIVAVHESANPRLRKVLPKGGKHWRGAYQITDIVAPNDQKFERQLAGHEKLNSWVSLPDDAELCRNRRLP